MQFPGPRGVERLCDLGARRRRSLMRPNSPGIERRASASGGSSSRDLFEWRLATLSGDRDVVLGDGPAQSAADRRLPGEAAESV